MSRNEKAFIEYEYKEVLASTVTSGLLLDGYESFGWEMTDRSDLLQEQQKRPHPSPKEKIALRRDRHISNKVELTRLERNFEACINEIEHLEEAKKAKGTAVSLTVGILGTALLALGVLSVTRSSSNYFMMVCCAVPGFIGWIIPYFLYKRLLILETRRLTPVIEQKYEEIYTLIRKGRRLSEQSEKGKT